MKEDAILFVKCIVEPLKDTLRSNKSDQEKFDQLKWYINSMSTILFPDEKLFEIEDDADYQGECRNHEL